MIENGEFVDIIDCPYLSSVPDGLKRSLSRYEGALFADICKEGPGGGILPSFVAQLHEANDLPQKWSVVSAPRTYNPLGSLETFLNSDDICKGFRKLLHKNIGNEGELL